MDWAGLAKQIFTFGTSSFDMGSDIANALTFMGYFTSSMNNGTSNVSHSSPYYNNQTIWENTTDDGLNVTAIRDRVHQIWGTMGLILVCVPGIITMFPYLIGAIYKKEWDMVCIYLIIALTFPLLFIVIQLVGVIMVCCKSDIKEINQSITRFTGVEASIESSGQLLLQIFTILFGYETDTIQKITIITSLIQLAKCGIAMDLECKLAGTGKKLRFKQLLIESVKRLPWYFSTIVFRIMSLAFTIGFLRMWSILPISLLLIEIFIIGWIRNKKITDRIEAFGQTIHLTLGNCGVMMVYPFFAGDEETAEVSEKDVQKYVRRSSIVSFVHHTITLSIILILVCYDRHYMEHWSAPYFLLNTTQDISRVHLFWVFGCTIMMGCYSLTLILYLSLIHI